MILTCQKLPSEQGHFIHNMHNVKWKKNKAFNLCYERLEVGVDSSNGAALAAYFWGHFTAAEAHCQYTATCSQTSHYRIVTRNFGVRFFDKTHTKHNCSLCGSVSAEGIGTEKEK